MLPIFLDYNALWLLPAKRRSAQGQNVPAGCGVDENVGGRLHVSQEREVVTLRASAAGWWGQCGSCCSRACGVSQRRRAWSKGHGSDTKIEITAARSARPKRTTPSESTVPAADTELRFMKHKNRIMLVATRQLACRLVSRALPLR